MHSRFGGTGPGGSGKWTSAAEATEEEAEEVLEPLEHFVQTTGTLKSDAVKALRLATSVPRCRPCAAVAVKKTAEGSSQQPNPPAHIAPARQAEGSWQPPNPPVPIGACPA